MQEAAPAVLLDGDLVFRTGTDVLANLVMSQADDARFSHVGMIMNSGTQRLVVHALPGDGAHGGGVQIEALADFTANRVARSVAYYRAPELDGESRAAAVRYLLSQAGRPFDYRFRYSEDEALYCTELVLKALAAANVMLAPTMERVFFPTLGEGAIPPDALTRDRRIRKIDSRGNPETHETPAPPGQSLQRDTPE